MHGTDQYGGGVWLLFLDFFDESLIEEYFRNINTPFDVELIVAWIDNPKEVCIKKSKSDFFQRMLIKMTLMLGPLKGDLPCQTWVSFKAVLLW